jgi:hypothetical protein
MSNKPILHNSKIFFLPVYIILVIIFSLLTLEFVYRFQIIDTYAPELRSYNSEEELVELKNRKTILVMGDSFTAAENSYVNILKKNLPKYRIINSGITGTGIIEATIVAPSRFKKFNPSIFIYQVYVGNDLFDITHPSNWEKISLLRSVYWKMSDSFKSLVFLNYRLGQKFFYINKLITGTIKDNNKLSKPGIYENEMFSVEKYQARIPIMLRAEPNLFENQIMVKDSRKKDFEIFQRKLEKLTSYCKPNQCKAFVLIIPHCCQINRKYIKNMMALGAEFHDKNEILKNNYPFFEETRENLKDNPNVVVLNPIQLLKDLEMHNKSMYFQNDEHLTADGQEAIAKYIIDEMFIME